MSKKRQRLNRHLFGKSKHSNTSSQKSHPTTIMSAQSTGFSPSQPCHEVDLHNLGLHDAKELIKKTARKASEDAETVLFIHGYNSGTAIQGFIRGGSLEQSLNAKGITGEFYSKGAGATYFDPSTRDN